MVSLQRQLLALRRARASLSDGAVAAVRANGSALCYERRHGDDRLVVVLNLAHDPASIDAAAGLVVAATHRDRLGAAVGSSVTLRPDEGLVIDPCAPNPGRSGGLDRFRQQVEVVGVAPVELLPSPTATSCPAAIGGPPGRRIDTA